MHLNKFASLSQAVTSLDKRGFTAQFVFRDGVFRDIKTKQTYRPDDLAIVEYHRFEGVLNPADTSIVFAIEVKNKKRGVLVMNYGTDTGLEVFHFMDKVRIKSGAR